MNKYITFDLDETLLQNPFSKWVFPEIESLVASHLTLEAGIFPEIRKEHKKRLAEKRAAAAYNWDDILEQILVEQNIPLKINIAELVEKHAEDPKVYLLESNALTVLAALKKKGYSLGVVTNGYYKYQYPVMKAIQLAEHIDRVITPCKVGCSKPAISMADPLLADGELIAHVGDRLDHDVYFANQLGALSILIDHRMPDALKPLTPEQRAQQQDYLTGIFQRKIYEELIPREHYQPKLIIHSIQELLEIELERPNLTTKL
ncbi:HAD family hydrolase [Bacillus sp. SD088]|uniref:HAD family hydrolase n=1 Tax=Bacillus sp. SD088 TaxID=2782012 RepID=UPI001A95BF68|nr:HAD family hydrolase [Bacillus sp. SD088]MBO0991741.1 HAD family hydrolase [Bacillus sp. SD088]